mgnify:CR=1 FL=1
MGNGNSNGGGIGFCGMLAIVFIALKLTGFIDWPWLLVLSPIWGFWLLVIVLAIIAAVISEIK